MADSVKKKTTRSTVWNFFPILYLIIDIVTWVPRPRPFLSYSIRNHWGCGHERNNLIPPRKNRVMTMVYYHWIRSIECYRLYRLSRRLAVCFFEYGTPSYELSKTWVFFLCVCVCVFKLEVSRLHLLVLLRFCSFLRPLFYFFVM